MKTALSKLQELNALLKADDDEIPSREEREKRFRERGQIRPKLQPKSKLHADNALDAAATNSKWGNKYRNITWQMKEHEAGIKDSEKNKKSPTHIPTTSPEHKPKPDTKAYQSNDQMRRQVQALTGSPASEPKRPKGKPGTFDRITDGPTSPTSSMHEADVIYNNPHFKVPDQKKLEAQQYSASPILDPRVGRSSGLKIVPAPEKREPVIQKRPTSEDKAAAPIDTPKAKHVEQALSGEQKPKKQSAWERAFNTAIKFASTRKSLAGEIEKMQKGDFPMVGIDGETFDKFGSDHHAQMHQIHSKLAQHAARSGNMKAADFHDSEADRHWAAYSEKKAKPQAKAA